MDCYTVRRSKTFLVLDALPILQPLPTVLLQLISEYTVVQFLAGYGARTIWIRELDGERQPWRVFHPILPIFWPGTMAVANHHLLILQPPPDNERFSVEKNIVALPLDSEVTNRTNWVQTEDALAWRLLVLSCGTPIALHFSSSFLHFGNVPHRIPVSCFHYTMHWTTTVIWNDCLILFGGGGPAAAQVAMWNPITTTWHQLPPLREGRNFGLAVATPIGLLLAGGSADLQLEPSTLIQCLPSSQCPSWMVLDWQLPEAVRPGRLWFLNGRLYFAHSRLRCWSLFLGQDEPREPRKIQTSDWIREPDTPHNFDHVFAM